MGGEGWHCLVQLKMSYGVFDKCQMGEVPVRIENQGGRQTAKDCDGHIF